MDTQANQADDDNRHDHPQSLILENRVALLTVKQLADVYPGLRVVRCDILSSGADAIVNAANELLTGGGGVDGIIHERGGERLARDVAQIPINPDGTRCRTGEAVVTGAYGIHCCRYIIHTVGPYLDKQDKPQPTLLSACYSSCLEKALQIGACSIAFPAISTGYYGYPMAGAAVVAVSTITEYMRARPHANLQIVLCAYSDVAEQHLRAVCG